MAKLDPSREPTPRDHCSHPSCQNTIPAHAWGRIKSDWFFQKNGEKFCPQHTPEWVEQWRANKKKT